MEDALIAPSQATKTMGGGEVWGRGRWCHSYKCRDLDEFLSNSLKAALFAAYSVETPHRTAHTVGRFRAAKLEVARLQSTCLWATDTCATEPLRRFCLSFYM